MTILNRPADGLLSVLLALRRALLTYGPQTETRLLQLCAPTAVVPDGKPDMARKTLTRWKQLGLFREVEGEVSLNSDIGRIEADDVDRFRAALLRLVLAPENNPALTSDSSEDHEGTKASDYTRAAAWALAQDPFAFPAKYRDGVESLQATQGIDPRPFANDTRWSGFADWAVFLGIGWNAAKIGLVLDPAFAVRAALEEIFGGTAELSQDVFLSRLALALPILDGGRYRMAVERQTPSPWRSMQQDEVSPSLSVALRTLDAKGDIRIEARADAPQKTLLGRGGIQLGRLSHLVRLGAT